MSDLQKGYGFSGSSPNNHVTAEKLNALVDSAVILPGFYTGKAEEIAADPGDFFLFYDASSQTYKRIQKGNLITNSIGRTGARGLVIASNAVVPLSKIDITAKELVMRSAAGNYRFATSFSQTVALDIYSGGSTPNGRDFATEAASTWYYVHAISDGTNDRGLFSASADSPTLPTGYLYSALLGAVRNDAGSNLIRFSQRGNRVMTTQFSSVGAAQLPMTGGVDFTAVVIGVAHAWQNVDISKCVPPGIAASVQGFMGGIGATNHGFALCSEPGSSGLIGPTLAADIGVQIWMPDQIAVWPTGYGNLVTGFPFDVGLSATQGMFWTSSSAAAGATCTLRVTGYELNL